MRSVRAAFAISLIRFRSILFSWRTAMICVLMGIYIVNAVTPFLDFSRAVNERVTPFLAPHMLDDQICQLFLMIGAVVLYAGAPYGDDLFPALIVRSGKTQMVIGNVLGMLWVALAYTVFLFVMMTLPLLPQMQWIGQWGKVWTTLGMYGTAGTIPLIFPISDTIRGTFTPLQAMLLSFSLEVGCVLFLGMCVYLGNQLTDRPVGLWIAGGLVVLDITIYNIFPYNYYRYAPLALARLSMYVRNLVIPLGGGPIYGYVFYICGILAMAIGLCVHINQKRTLP